MSKNACCSTDGWKLAQLKNKQTGKERAIQNELKYMENPKQCAHCNKIIPYMSRRNKFCSSSCSAIVGNVNNKRYGGKSSPLKKNRVYTECVNCGKPLDKRQASKFCDSVCSGKHQVSKSLEWWLNEGMYQPLLMPQYARQYWLDMKGRKCEECGWNKINPKTGKSPLTIEHTDGNCMNNIPENIKVLCPSCHSLTPTYGALNKGNSKRVKRYKAKPD